MFAGISCLLLSGCATVSMLPKDAATVDFGSAENNKAGLNISKGLKGFNGYNA